MFVKPAEGRAIRHPHTMTLLRDDGEHVPETVYWLRARSAGDVVETDTPAPAAVDAPAGLPSPESPAPAAPAREAEEPSA